MVKRENPAYHQEPQAIEKNIMGVSSTVAWAQVTMNSNETLCLFIEEITTHVDVMVYVFYSWSFFAAKIQAKKIKLFLMSYIEKI